MKKTIFKTISLLLLSIFISGCEKNDDGVFDATDEKLLEESSKAYIIDEFGEDNITNSNSSDFRIVGYEGPIFIFERRLVPFVGTYIIVETDLGGAIWKTTGSLKVEGDPRAKRVRILRTNREAGSILLLFWQGGGIITSFVEAPAHARCPDDTDTQMITGNNRVIQARNYIENFTYEWEVSNGGATYNETGKSVTVPAGSSIVTLTVSNNTRTLYEGCTTKPTRTQIFNFDDNPSTQCPGNEHAMMRVNEINRIIYAQNYDSSYTYTWTVVRGSSTSHSTGSSVRVSAGSSTVTLTVSKTGCTTQTKTQNVFIDACPTC